jgi:phosphopantothenate synthetase
MNKCLTVWLVGEVTVNAAAEAAKVRAAAAAMEKRMVITGGVEGNGVNEKGDGCVECRECLVGGL